MRRFIRDDSGVHFDKPSPSYNQKDFVPLEVKAGSLVVIHGDLVHQRWKSTLPIVSSIDLTMADHTFAGIPVNRSFENLSEKSRHALSLHAVETVGCTWAPDNWYVWQLVCCRWLYNWSRGVAAAWWRRWQLFSYTRSLFLRIRRKSAPEPLQVSWGSVHTTSIST